ncbi:hypothetical protein JCM11251_005307 [Rhodosporidiobolus azoricus]
MSSKKGGKMTAIINYRVRVVLNDSRALVGQLLAFDKHMNLVLAECDEFRRVKRKGTQGAKAAEEDDEEDEMKRTLGLVILRGETIVTLSVEGPPPVQDDKLTALAPGPGFGAPAGRGMGLPAAAPTMRQAPTSFQPPPGMPGMAGGPPPGFPPPGFQPPPGFAPR